MLAERSHMGACTEEYLSSLSGIVPDEYTKLLNIKLRESSRILGLGICTETRGVFLHHSFLL